MKRSRKHGEEGGGVGVGKGEGGGGILFGGRVKRVGKRNRRKTL